MRAEPELETLDITLNVGPQHPATHGVFRMVLTVDGERLVDGEPYIGYMHRGAEKLCENLDLRQAIGIMDRTEYLGNFNAELSYVMAAEKIVGVRVPERAEYIRVMLCELNRITSHFMFMGAFGTDLGIFGTAFMYSFRERERIQDLFEAVTGERLMYGYFRVGGVAWDLPEGFEEDCRRVLREVRQGIADIDGLMTDNEVMLVRCRGIGAISAEEAINWGLSGPMLRASGVHHDLRRAEPYSVYDRFDFEIPVGEQGDVYDRYWVRLQEMEQSCRIVEQVLDQMPKDGPIMGELPRVMRLPPGEVYIRTEAPRGEYGIYMVSKGGNKPYRLKIRASSFCNLSVLKRLLRDTYLADAVIILGSIDIVLCEVDR